MANFIHNNNNKIFVSIACFMDNDIINTIDDCLAKSKYPENIIFGVCLQYDPSDNFFEKYDNHPQVKVVKMPYCEAKGPAYARGLIYDLFTDEDYFFQIDCHTRFFQYWDDKIINHYKHCCSIYPKVVISHYPININNMNNEDHSKQIAHISTVRCIDIHNGIKTHGRFINSNSPPKESYGISAAMLFFDKHTYYTVPFDKEIYGGLQFEEQTVLAARYWTHGYNIYQMNEHVIATEYITNTARYNVRPSTNPILKQNTHNKLYHIMKLKYDDTYVNNTNSLLGTERTIEDYYRFLQIYDTVVSTYPDNYLHKSKITNTSNNVNYSKKILILVLSSPGVYEKTNNISLHTWASNLPSNIRILFYYGNSNTRNNNNNSNEITIDCDDNRDNILLKTIKMFQYATNNFDFDFDYVLRLCACSYINIQKLQSFVAQLPNDLVFSGPINTLSEGAASRLNLDRIPFITGANMLFSKDVINKLVLNINNFDYKRYGRVDDVAISLFINENVIKREKWVLQSWIHIDFSTMKNILQLKINNFYHYHYNHRFFLEHLMNFHNKYHLG